MTVIMRLFGSLLALHSSVELWSQSSGTWCGMDEARALALDVVRQWFTRPAPAMDGWIKWKDIWVNQLEEQFAQALAAAEARGEAKGLRRAKEEAHMYQLVHEFKNWCETEATKVLDTNPKEPS